MNNINLSIYPRSDYKRKNGTNTLYLRITIKRKIKVYHLPISINTKYWNSKIFRLRDSAPGSHIQNKMIAFYENKARQIECDFNIKNSILTINEFDRLFNNDNYGSNSFYDFIDTVIEQSRGVLANGTIRIYETHKTKLQKFRKELSFLDIDGNFLDSYQNYMITELNNNPNTVSKTFRTIKALLNRAKQNGLIEDHVFNNFKIKSHTGNRKFLTIEELDKLHKLVDSDKLKKGENHVLKSFLFSCYTGIRYGDIKELKHRDLKEDFINIKMQKTKRYVRVPLINRAKCLISDNCLANENVFRVYSNQPSNRYLKDIMKIAGIDKNISFHCGRHTFATNGITLGIPIEVISELLGHTDIKTTQIYIKYTDNVKVENMEKWNEV